MKKPRSDKTPMVGRRYGHWFVVSDEPGRLNPGGRVSRRVKVRCDCGVLRIVDAGHLLDGRSRQCRECGYEGTRIYGNECSIEGCKGSVRSDSSHGRGMCSAHYMRWRRGKRGLELAAPVQKRRSPA